MNGPGGGPGRVQRLRRRGQNPETKLAKQILKAICGGQYPGLLLERNNTGMAVYDSGARVAYGVGGTGGADYIGCYRGRYVATEMKMPGEDRTADQEQCERRVRRAGGEYVVLRSVEQAIAWIDGLSRRWPCEP